MKSTNLETTTATVIEAELIDNIDWLPSRQVNCGVVPVFHESHTAAWSIHPNVGSRQSLTAKSQSKEARHCHVAPFTFALRP
jgi:hypothetical protein